MQILTAGPVAIIVAGMFFLLGLGIMLGAFQNWKEKRLLEDTATQTARSAAVGRIALTGTGHAIDEPLQTPLSGEDCLLASYDVQRYRHSSEEPGGGEWVSIESGTIVEPFEINDGTGSMRVVPDERVDVTYNDNDVYRETIDGSENTPQHIVQFLREHTDIADPVTEDGTGYQCDELRRYTEQYIPVESSIFLFGAAQIRDDTNETDEKRLEIIRDSSSGKFLISGTGSSPITAQHENAWRGFLFGLGLSAVTLYVLLTQFGFA